MKVKAAKAGDRYVYVDIARFIGIFLIMYLHTSFAPYTFANVPNGHELIATSTLFLEFFASRISSPLLGFFSGIFTFFLLQKLSRTEFIVKRLKSLVIPALVWNIVFLLALLLKYYFTGTANTINELPKSIFHILLPFFSKPANYPLHYLFDLFEISILFSIIHLKIREKNKILFFLCALFTLAGLFFETNLAQPFGILPRYDLFLFYLLGYCFAAYGADMNTIVRSYIFKLLFLVALAFFTLCIIEIFTSIVDRQKTEFIVFFQQHKMVPRILGSILVLYLSLVLSNQKIIPKINNRVIFFAFCSHIFIIGGIATIMNIFEPTQFYRTLAYLTAPVLSYSAAYVMQSIDKNFLHDRHGYSPFGA